jgi:hypothetical protein
VPQTWMPYPSLARGVVGVVRHMHRKNALNMLLLRLSSPLRGDFGNYPAGPDDRAAVQSSTEYLGHSAVLCGFSGYTRFAYRDKRLAEGTAHFIDDLAKYSTSFGY